jgi:type IV pilus assembly protein PilE
MQKKLSYSQHGFTLIELMITVAVIGILSAIAYPSYQEQLRKGKRAECRSGLFQVMQQQERYFTQFNAYAAAAPADASPKVKVFSSDSGSANSACKITSAVCDATTALTACVKVSGEMQPTGYDNAVKNLILDSKGEKSCKLADDSISTTEKKCWP